MVVTTAMETGVDYLLEASVKLQCDMETTARALLLYHHFMRCVDGSQYDESIVAAAALNLSGRINEKPLNLDYIVMVFHSIVNRKADVISADDISFMNLKETLKAFDFMMLRALEFNLNHRLAHQYMVPFLSFLFHRSINIADYRQELSLTCIRLLSDFYTIRNCLNFKPEHIAIASIDLSLYIHGLINELAMIPVWYQGFCADISVDKIRRIKKEMLQLYKSKNNVPIIEIKS